MPDLLNRPEHELALAAAIRPVFLSIAAQGATPKWDEAEAALAAAMLPVLTAVDANARAAMGATLDLPQLSQGGGSVSDLSRTIARSLIYAREDAWIAARRTAREIEPPAGEADISDDLLMLYLLYGLPKRRPLEMGLTPFDGGIQAPRGIAGLMQPGLQNDLMRLDRLALSDAWEAHLADYVPGEGRGLVAVTLGPQAASDIAVTETTRANSRAERAAAEDFERATGKKIVAYWVTERDSRVCKTCLGLGGKAERVWLSEFPDGPPAHPNCRCWLSWEVEG